MRRDKARINIEVRIQKFMKQWFFYPSLFIIILIITSETNMMIFLNDMFMVVNGRISKYNIEYVVLSFSGFINHSTCQWCRELIYIFVCCCREVNFEVIIVDDGSPDGTQEIVKQLQQLYGDDRIVSSIDFIISLH